MSIILVAAALWQVAGGAVDVPRRDSAGEVLLAQADSGLPVPSLAPPTEVPAPPSRPPPSAPPPGLPNFGLLLEAGFPDGLSLSAVYRPFTWIRASAGAAYNLSGFGVRGGLALIPLDFFLAPSLSVDVGQFFEFDTTTILALVLPQVDLGEVGGLIKHVSYRYGTASLGLELGSPRHFVIFLRVGVSYVEGTLGGFEAFMKDVVGPEEAPNLEAKDLLLRATLPAARLGIIAYF